jgi:hypothetical protein
VSAKVLHEKTIDGGRTYSDVGECDILNARVDVEVLTQTSDGHTVAANSDRVLHHDPLVSRFDGDAVIATLVDEVGQCYVVPVHVVEALLCISKKIQTSLHQYSGPNCCHMMRSQLSRCW